MPSAEASRDVGALTRHLADQRVPVQGDARGVSEGRSRLDRGVVRDLDDVVPFREEGETELAGPFEVEHVDDGLLDRAREA